MKNGSFSVRNSVRWGLWAVVALLAIPALRAGEPFTLLVYNVENLFDIDGVARFEDYRQDGGDPATAYTPRKLLTKLEHIATTLKAVNDGAGPEIVVFSEFEFDRTPARTAPSIPPRYRDQTVAELLTENPSADIRDLPVQILLHKLLEERGMRGYRIRIQKSRPITDAVPAHTNAVFSKFPIRKVRSHLVLQARDILEVTLDVKGYPLTVFANHWRSGASDPDTESIRIQNARVLRRRIDALLAEDPMADIVVAGDLNSNYNQQYLLPAERTGINTILKSQGDELAVRRGERPPLYNLWFELEPEKRFSEVYRGHYSTLMHILLARGLYDYRGIQYVDNSFRQLILPGQNARKPGWEPVRWHFFGETGGGFSDHLPIYARFRIVEAEREGYLQLDEPGRNSEVGRKPIPVPKRRSPADARPVSELDGLPIGALADRFGEFFKVSGMVTGQDPLRIRTAGREFEVYIPDQSLFARMRRLGRGAEVTFYGELDVYRGRIQFVIENPSWAVRF